MKNELIRSHFPRKGVDVLPPNLRNGKIKKLDEIKKKVWIELVKKIFLTVHPLSWESEIIPFLDILSCGLMNYPQSCLILKTYAVAVIQTSRRFPEKIVELVKDHILGTDFYLNSCVSYGSDWMISTLIDCIIWNLLKIQ